MKNFRYELDKSSRKFICPGCEKRRFVKFIDIETNQYLPDHFGRCDREEGCMYFMYPPKGYKNAPQTFTPSAMATRYKKIFEAGSRPITEPINTAQKVFTQISIYKKGDDPAGVIKYYTLSELAALLNQFKNVSGNKDKAPGFLKGIYKGGTTGGHCITPSSFLPFDIDVKNTEDKKENIHLFTPEKNQKVFEALQEISVLAWRSNSRKGMAGYIYAPELTGIPNEKKDEHLKKAKAIYKHIEQIIFERTEIKIQLDPGQGKFRQIRYIAEQDEIRHINFNPLEFYTVEKRERIPRPPEPPPGLIPFEVLKTTLKNYDQNNFIQNLLYNVPYPFLKEDAMRITELYKIGTAPNGFTCFPFIDKSGDVYGIQEKIFDKQNNTDKSRKYNTGWIHARLTHTTYKNKPLPGWLEYYNKNKKPMKCLFGEHLLNSYPENIIVLVEAPKDAIYGTLYFGFPEDENGLLWLATGSMVAFTYNRIKVLEGRKILIIPDLSKDGSAFEIWSNKVYRFNDWIPGAQFQVLDILERIATKQDRLTGSDVSDILIRKDWRDYRPQHSQDEPAANKAEDLPNGSEKKESSERLQRFFDSIDLSKFDLPPMKGMATPVFGISLHLQALKEYEPNTPEYDEAFQDLTNMMNWIKDDAPDN